MSESEAMDEHVREDRREKEDDYNGRQQLFPLHSTRLSRAHVLQLARMSVLPERQEGADCVER